MPVWLSEKFYFIIPNETAIQKNKIYREEEFKPVNKRTIFKSLLNLK